jgi:alkanesulfonate monooxygenase SsuD/methylene tetrahydromethanopterin reductase-like flavin-dependent oxidoreductase (luciferase family)
MKFGVQASQSQIAWPDLLEMWLELDRSSRFDSLWLMDHFVTGAGQAFGSEGPCLESWTALAALAQATAGSNSGLAAPGISTSTRHTAYPSTPPASGSGG